MRPGQATATRRLLVEDAERVSTLLERLGPDRVLVELDTALANDWAAWSLMSALRELPTSDRSWRATAPNWWEHQQRRGGLHYARVAIIVVTFVPVAVAATAV